MKTPKNTSATPVNTPSPRLTPEERFKQNVAKPNSNGCELWTGGQFSNGYGAFCAGNQVHYAHRYAFEMHNKTLIPPGPGQYVLHSCDVKTCTAKKHLRLGSAADNARDKQERGRSTKGRRLTRRAFLPAEMTRIVEMAANGCTAYAIAKALSRGEPVIAGVLKRHTKQITEKRAKLALANALEAFNTSISAAIDQLQSSPLAA